MSCTSFILTVCLGGLLLQTAYTQSVKGGSRGVKGGSHSSSSSSSSRVYHSKTSSSQAQEPAFQREQYPQSNAAPHSSCDRPSPPMNGGLVCQNSNNRHVCTGSCNTGHKFPDGTETMELECSELNGLWSPYRNFPDCVGSYGGGYDSSYQRQQGSGHSQSSSRQSSYSNTANDYGQSQQAQQGLCLSLQSPMNGQKSCRMSSGQWTCQGACNPGYEFSSGITQMTLSCHDRDGVWSPAERFPDCTRQQGSGYSQSSSHQSSYNSGAHGYGQSQQVQQSLCQSPQSPINGQSSCRMSSGQWTCQGTCNPGFEFSVGSTHVTLNCHDRDGVWSPAEEFPECIRSYNSGAHGYGQSQQSSYNSGAQGYGQSQQVQQGLCGSPNSPMNGRIFCSMSSGQKSCQGTCNPGYQFSAGNTQMTLTCYDRDGVWLPAQAFPDCTLLCHPECQNGGQCVVHNQCICPSTHRGNRCQYSVELCNFNRIASVSLYSDCNHGPEFTECRISCPPGMTFQPPTTSVYRCTVDGHWNPPTAPECVTDSLCERPPPPMNGRIECQGNSEIMLCRAVCTPGYLFPDGFSELSIQCVRRTGEWSPDVGFPDCEPICNPACENGGKCLGHNSCLCPRGYRGGRCQYPTSNCDGHDRFASVVWNCQNGEKETVCHISCGHSGSVLQPAEPAEYTCSLDGAWQPDLKPICVTDHSVIDRRTSHNERYVVGGESQQRHSNYESSSSAQGSNNRGSQFGGQQPVDYDFGGQQQVDYDFGGQQQMQQDFGGQLQTSQDFDRQQQVNRNFEGQQQVRHDFGGQPQNNNGQQQMGNRFSGQQPVDYDFEGQQQVDYDLDSGKGRSNLGGNPEPYQEKETGYQNYGQNPVDYQDNLQQQSNLEGLHLTRQEQGKESFDSGYNKGGYVEREDEDEHALDDEDAKEIRQHVESETEGSNVDVFSHIDKVSSYHGICSVWGYHHYRSFDGGVFTFPSSCPYILASKCGHEDLVISLLTECDSHGPCERTIGIQLQENRYMLSYDRGLIQNDMSLPIPTHIGELTVERVARYLVARLNTGFTIWINEENTVLIVANPFMKNRTCGMCGNYDSYLDPKFIREDGSKTDDIYSFANSWKRDPDGICVDNVEPRLPCNADTRENRLVSDKANLVCAALYSAEFHPCTEFVDVNIYYARCQMDCCSLMTSEDCECPSIGEFVLECSRSGADMNGGWRTPALCPMICINGTEYRECGPPCPSTCDDQEPTCQQERCVDGCHCPEGTVLEDGQCITVDQCPCHHGENIYATGKTMEQDCNTCVCQGGSWQCTDSICPAICSVSGPHFQTFDGLNYDFSGFCTHYLVDLEDSNVQIDYSNNCRELPSLTSVCVRSITIHTSEGAVVKLKQTMEVSVNGREMISLPVLAPGVYVGQSTSKYIRAQLNNGLEIVWDMDASIQIYAPVSLFGEVKGLCGTFTKSQHDDFLTPEGDVEQSSRVFAEKWRLEENCMDMPSLRDMSEQEKPCDRAPQRRSFASKICGVIKGDEFRECHSLIDYQGYYDECMEDICGCMTEPTSCSCLSLSNYATACSKKGRPLSWRQNVPVCGIPCPKGQIYLACANPCTYTCAEVAYSYASCREDCIEGCVCPPGQTLDAHSKCVAVSACSCVHSGHVYPPDFMQRRGKEMCECSQGQWACHEASPAEIILTPPPHIAHDCNATANLESTDCVSECPITCANLHHHQPCTTAVCVPGCRCKKGFIMDTTTGKCVQPIDCPCHHSGKSYEEGEEVTMDCHKCTCESGTWFCDSNPCPGLCSAWGDSHYETFDGRLYDFEGSCDYVMVKAHVTESVVFSVVIQNIPCGGGGGATCGKSLFITLGGLSVTLTKDHPLPDVAKNSRLSVSSVGMFTLVESDVGISVQWDRNTRVYVTAQPIWENKLQGLCGDFNGDSSDDFRSPSGGVPLVLAKHFADSWRVHKYCKPASQAENTCDKYPERRTWSKHKCSVLKLELFKPCHYQVEVEEYFKRCVHDACACNSGGDCDCLCAVVSAYAQKCARRGVEIEWRSQELCPIQCESCDRYSPCISLCSPPNCDTYLDDSAESQSCARQPCVDGCEPKPCDIGQVHQSATNLTCIPEHFCSEKPCTVIGGVPYREGERIESREVGDSCQSCYCRRGDVECVGMPCTSTSPKPTVGLKLGACEFTGWTDWINSVDPSDVDGDDIEDLGDLVDSNRIPCPFDNITSIQCRVAETQEPSEASGQVVTCDKENGLLCKSNMYNGICEDYEIRVYCRCHEEVTCPPGQEWDTCAFNCENVCHSMETYLNEEGACDHNEECVPGCIKKVCRLPTLARDAETCVTPDMCTCRLNSGYVLAPGEVIADGCQKCQCLNNTLICSTTLECREIITEIPLPLPLEEISVYEPSPTPGIQCLTGWTEWQSLHIPDRQGEKESLEDLEQEKLINCGLDKVSQIQCREVKTSKLIEHSGQNDIHCDLRSKGLVCKNKNMPSGTKCPDFEIKAYCDCDLESQMYNKVKPARPRVTTTIALRPRIVVTEQPVTGIVTTTASCSYWSPWIDKNKPRKGKKHGEKEDTKPYILKQTQGFCLEGYVSAIDCREESSEKDYRETNEEKLICDLNKGFQCQNKHQPDNRCLNYKIRYFCTCGEEKTPVPILIKPTFPSHIYPCSELIPLIDGPKPLPDSQIKASSSESYRSGPDAIKMKRQEQGKAWTAAESDTKQFVEVDLGDVRAIYGVVTKGKEDSDEWVTSYQLLYSADGVSYSYYQENDINKVFSGNYDDSVEVKHIFSQAFEARYVRLEPLSWEEKISLRMDLLGCAKAITTTEYPAEPFEMTEIPGEEEEGREEERMPELGKLCSERMGLENGLLMDSQLSASSSYSSRFTSDLARLGSESIWAAAVQDDKQYLQVDFIDPQRVAGIITKGREDVPQWVTAYVVEYSNDGTIWNKIKDDDDREKEFPANYDAYSTVENLFPNVIRARFLKIHPTKWKNWISMQIEVLGCYHPEPCRDPMGVENGVVTDHQLTASSEMSESLSANDARLSSSRAWSPEASDKNPFIQVDLLEPMNLAAVITKGNPEIQQWVRSFYVAYSNDSMNWKKVENVQGRAKEFSGNKDQDSAVINLFPIPVTARYISIIPLHWHRMISLRFELLGCFHEKACLEPMGLENGVLSDSQITASSSLDLDTTPSHARISGKSGWQPDKLDKHPYLQVDFLEDRNISAVVTKGMEDADNWVTSFKVVYSSDGRRWFPIITDDGDDVEFEANKDRDTPVVNILPETFEARYFRVVPLDFENEIGLRLELLGCYHPYECQEPMGIESGSIFDFQISASSYLNDELSPTNARLDGDTAWVAETDDDDPFIQVDFMVPTNVTGLMTRGRNDANEWVKEYTVLYSNDGESYFPVLLEGKSEDFQANLDSESPVTNLFPGTINTRFLRILPTAYERRVAMRFEVFGCHYETECMEPMGLENGLLSDSHITASSYKQNSNPTKLRLSSDASWLPYTIDEPQYVQVDFGDPRNISAIVTKGDDTEPVWVTAYQVAYSDDEDTWTAVEDNEGNPIDFSGNVDNDSPAINVLPETIQAQFIRLIPTDWKDWIALRAEILGCYHPYEEPEKELTTIVSREEVLPLLGVVTEPTMVALCPDPMEPEVSLMIGARIKASSSTPNGGPSRVLLHTHANKNLSGGWVPKVNDLHPVLFIELPQTSFLTSIYIQGREDEENWVKTYRVVASPDNSTWMPMFGPNGDEVIEGNTNQHKVVGHFFKNPEEARFVKIIPETWHRWPSFRLDLKGCSVTQVSTIPAASTIEYAELCPELMDYPELAVDCPEDCPDGQLCDGKECVDPVDCACVHDGQLFKVSDRIEDHSCKQCDCALDGHTICREKQCEPCEEDKTPVLSDDCSCTCEECGEDERLCPTSKECIPEERWCDGIVDCPDDETNCLYTSVVTPGPGFSPEAHRERIRPLKHTTPAIASSTTPSGPAIASTTASSGPAIALPTTPPGPGNATCDIIGKHINTFDGQDIAYDICNHVVMKDIQKEKFNITIHKECGYFSECKHWINIYYKDQHIKVQSNLTVQVNGHSYTTGQLWRMRKKTKMSLITSKVGEQVIVKSIKDKFTIIYDVRGQLKIEVPSEMRKKIFGLCGYYSGKIEDDQRKPNGRKAFTSQEFGDSWAVGEKENECKPLICPHEEMKKSVELCHKLKEDPFVQCGTSLPLNQFLEFCMSSTCECLLNKKNSENKCKCDSFLPFVEACESKLGPLAVRNWRLIHECHTECPPGMEWNDCGPSCQLTCDSASADTLEECSGKCVPGCFCPPGTVLNKDMCIPPDQCADQVCQGFGDPHFRTFDGLFFPFQGVGSFLIVSDNGNNFEVKGMSKKCGLFNPITCLVGMEITYKQHKIDIMKDKELKVDGENVHMDALPMHRDGMVILGYPGRTFVVAIPQINLEARYFEENSGFAVRVPSRKYFNNTRGLCGNCNGRKADELKKESLNDYICSWQTDGDKEECMESLEELPELTEEIPICEKLQDPVFAACHPLVDVDVYVDACNFDAVHSKDNQASFCKTAMEYGRQCCQAGISVENWPRELGCDIDCPLGMNFEQCHKGCPQTCMSLKKDYSDPSCNQVETDGCFCPEGKVLKDDACVDMLLCETCDEEGHVPGDTWEDGECKQCKCRHDLSIECMTERCPTKPICSKSERLSEAERDSSSCCESYVCAPKKEDCAEMKIPKCKTGEVAKTHSGYDGCPIFECECDPLLCAPVVWPDLEEGQNAVVTNNSCCPSVRIECIDDLCPNKPVCDDGLELVTIEGECCSTYKCKPPKDVCVYTHMYKVVEGFSSIMEQVETDFTIYQPGEKWEDGLCETCKCVESKGQYVPFCEVDHCPTLNDMPENKDYILQEMQIPNKCCPDIFKIQCRDEDGNIYEPGEEWQDEDNPCVTYLCEQEGSEVIKTKSVINCTECPRTAILFPPSKALGQCCGVCKITKCEDDDELHDIGDSWISKEDECKMAECVSEYGNVKTVYTRQPCPTIPSDCPPDKIMRDEKGCCKVCNLTSELSCSSGPIPEEDTIGFFTYNEPSQGGICVNERPVPQVLQCKGACHSQSYYSLEDGDFKDTCKCCKVNITVNRTVELRCPNGNSIRKTFLQPESCQCSKCAPKSGTSKKNDFNSHSWDQQSQLDTDAEFFQKPSEDFNSQTWEKQNQWDTDSEIFQQPSSVERLTDDKNEQKPQEPWQFQQNQVQQEEDFDI